jgi:putative thiazole-containing bacteriocin maturation protein
MRLKVKRDTFYLPEPNRGVYFRNNLSSFRIEGSGIDQWIEKLLPMFNGEYTLGNLTNGLSGPYRDRVYEIAEVLYTNGYVRDLSQDLPHQLSDYHLKKHASQIEFVDNLVGSGAARFQAFRQNNFKFIGLFVD